MMRLLYPFLRVYNAVVGPLYQWRARRRLDKDIMEQRINRIERFTGREYHGWERRMIRDMYKSIDKE